MTRRIAILVFICLILGLSSIILSSYRNILPINNNQLSSETGFANNFDKSGFVVFGPYISLPQGTYKLKAFVNTPKMPSRETEVGILEITADVGKEKIYQKILTIEELQKGVIEANFNLTKSYSGIEFRIFKAKKLILDFNRFELHQINGVLNFTLSKLFNLLCFLLIGIIICLGLYLIALVIYYKTEKYREWSVFVILFLVYLLIGQSNLIQPPSGDEPHYLLIMKSLIQDRDFDLANNYDQKDYSEFYQGYLPDRHISINRLGQQLPSHGVAFPVLSSIFFNFGGLAGVRIFEAFLTALLAAVNLKFIKTKIGIQGLLPIFLILVLYLSPPMIYYSAAIYPEVLAGLILVCLLDLAIGSQSSSGYIFFLKVFLIVFTPWLGFKYLFLSIPLYILIAWQNRKNIRRLSFLILIFVIGIGIFEAFLFYNYSTFNPSASYALPKVSDVTELLRKDKAYSTSFLNAVFGYFFDQQVGLVFYSPVYLLAVYGLGIQYRLNRKSSLILMLPLMSYLSAYALSQSWGGPVQASRVVVAIVPILVVTACIGYREWLKFRSKWIPRILMVISLTNATYLILNSELLYNNLYMKNEPYFATSRFLYRLGEPWIDFSGAFPSMLEGGLRNWSLLLFWIILFICLCCIEILPKINHRGE